MSRSLSLNVRWLPGGLASCFHAAAALLSKRPLADQALANALAAPTDRLRAALDDERISPEIFLAHLIPLAAETAGLHQLAEVNLIKMVGRAQAMPRVRRFWDLLSDLKAAFASVLPHCVQDLSVQVPGIQGRWNADGIGIMAGIVNGTEPDVLVAEATVLVIHPALGGGGDAFVHYNVASLEAVAEQPIRELPEIVRLAWLVALLNLDLPVYSEDIRADRQAIVAGLAMIPIALTAAAAVRMARCDEAAIEQAIEAWMPPRLVGARTAEEWAALLIQWHGTYLALRPPLGTALKGLDVLMRDVSSEPEA